MNREAIFHNPVSNYAFPISYEKFKVRLRAGKGDLDRVTLVIGNKYLWHTRKEVPMEVEGSDELFDYYSYVYPVDDPRVAYYFLLEKGDEQWLYGDSGFAKPELVNIDEDESSAFVNFHFPFINRIDIHKKPSWVNSAVFYQIFPERFCNGNPKLSPENVAPWGTAPDRQIFMGGDLPGITQKLSYLEELGVNALYLTPIFEATSNHKYDTVDYTRIDPHFGDESDLVELINQAHKRGIRVILDGVFNHTGSQSRYFNADGFYPAPGAAQGPISPYYSWYSFHPFPTDYDAWWGIKNLPAVNERNESYVNYIITGENSIVRRWLRAGASAWRLDVADELPDEFIFAIRAVMQQDFPDAYLLGEVWEDGTTKVAYSKRRRYLLGSGLHGLMNYPFRTALLSYLAGTSGAEDFRDAMETIRENYPSPAFYGAMNFLSTHDTPRLLTLLGCEQPPADRDARAHYRLSPAERERGTALLKLAALVLYAFPGSPTVYYGDEAGMEGFEDPFNRRTYPWGHEDTALLDWFRTLGRLRAERESLQSGGIAYPLAAGRVLCFARRAGDEVSLCAVNAGAESASVDLPWAASLAHDALSGQSFLAEGGRLHITLAPYDALLLTE